MQARDAGLSPRVAQAWRVLRDVPDPELPALPVTELGIVREVVDHGAAIEVVVTPTYSGCPATEAIARSIVDALQAAGLAPVRVTQRRAPAWTSDWITPVGRARLRACGIAPPMACAGPAAAGVSTIRLLARDVACPRCGSARTERLSAFGSTACKSLYRCLDCRDPFEHFKPI